MSEAVRLGVCASNPISDLSSPRAMPKPIKTYPLEQIDQLLEASRNDPMMYAYYLCFLSTGMRPGEIRGLKWDVIDTDNGLIQCRRTASQTEDGKDYIAETTKTKRSHTIAIAEDVATAIDRWRHQQRIIRLAHPDWHDENIVFDRGDGRVMPASTLRYRHRKLCEAHGIPYIHPHGFRHTNDTIELDANTNPKIVQDRLGHATVSMTLNRYTHVSPSLQRSAADALGERLLHPESRARNHARKIND